MRFVPFTVSAVITIALIVCLDRSWGSLPPLGRLLSPQEGFWQNATSISKDYNEELQVPGLKGKVEVWLDDRMVPHIFAENTTDAYYVQGYMHARDRLWQMELQSFAAAGRLSEILGAKMIPYDRQQRRNGMLYGAEQALKAMEADSVAGPAINAYSEGINAYINTLTSATLPLEYKLLNYKPEQWTPLNSALLLKMMAADLAGGANDLVYTNARRIFSKADFDNLYPDFGDSIDPIIPRGTQYPAPTVKATPPVDSILNAAGIALHFKEERPDPDNGSNNWAVAGSKTRAGAPILCNDPHLGLSLPSLWYETQIHTPDMNVYGATLPGAPGVIIGFNDHIAWGVTNAAEDVKDYYLMQFRNGKQQYLFNGAYRDAEMRIEKINVKGAAPYYDTVAYTVWGPVVYDNVFPDTATNHQFLAMRWKALDPSVEIRTFLELNKAHNYDDYLSALKYYACPAQNFAFAAKTGEIALWHNGQFPLRWKDQGKWIMPGSDSSFAWQGYVPQGENPHIYNPARGFVSSANQHPTDSTYPYRYVADFDLFRGKRINEVLAADSQITIQDMMDLQNDNLNPFARAALPLIRKHLPVSLLTADQKNYWQILDKWDLQSGPDSKAATIFNIFWDELQSSVWDDDILADKTPLQQPWEKTTLLWLLRDSAMKFIDNVHTPEKETLSQIVLGAFTIAADSAKALDAQKKLEFGRFRGTNIRHLTRSIIPFSAMNLRTGGGRHIVNATKQLHGPSWKMVVQLSAKTEAYGIYPGGQSGNPGSPYYDNAVQDWVQGKYYLLHVFDLKENDDPAVKFKIHFSKG
ncbi:penicillin acylase family protein [Chitinophaga pinensis]|uniref:Penicillin acylase family protein n=1 Tax=Chitinophaga pinensis TaxID=79329 RepID=A0A5C6LMD5_9BACT|nr:penicillin acylase family protein [Chitinophaga pinensis]TWV93613.1 penicillin acylase family protein [Chitinophaga pinensis]